MKTEEIKSKLKNINFLVLPKIKIPAGKLPIKKVLMVLAIILILGVIFYFTWGKIFAAKVNGRFITRASYIKELEEQGGKQQLDSMISQILIKQEAEKKNIKIGEDILGAEIAKIEDGLKQQGTTLDQALAEQNMTRENLKNQVELRKLVEQMVEYKQDITEDEIDQYIAANKATYDEQKLNTTTPEFRDQIKSLLVQFKQQSYNLEIQKWLEQLKQGAKIKIYGSK